MCGRFYLLDLFGLLMRFKLKLSPKIKPRYNIAPTQDIVAVINDGGYRVVHFRWGLIPFWSKKIVSGMINARAETVEKKPSFKHSLQSKRCLIPANGFYEWKKEGNRKKPHRIFLKDETAFSFAGLWDSWISPKGESINSCTIITTSANALIEPIHNRMPVILSEDAEKVWLNKNADIATLKGMLNPYPPELMKSHEISTTVNNPRNDSPEVLNPL